MSQTLPLDHSQLIFPEASKIINSTLTDLKRSNLTITNRLKSIKHDADFVQRVADTYQLPLIANERCGSWYIPPDRKAGSAYFKSTDGHHGQWSFSLRRLNFHILEVVGEKGGCIIVDSTRRGKSMPDALSKTVPIWISVLNRLLFPEQSDSHPSRTPEDVVSRSEHAQIEADLPKFVDDLRTLELDIESLRSQLQGRPFEAVWVTPDSSLEMTASRSMASDCNLIVLCTASGRTNSIDRSTMDYVQGAADDSESWACGLDARCFWNHVEELLSTPEDDLPELIRTVVRGESTEGETRAPVVIQTTNVSIADNAAAGFLYQQYDVIISCSEQPNDPLAQKLRERYLHLACTSGKVGSRQLREQLSKLLQLEAVLRPSNRILITCQSGRDLAVGVALAFLCFFCTDNNTIRRPEQPAIPSKSMIKKRLSWIMISMPDAAPSRATLQSVNAFLFG